MTACSWILTWFAQAKDDRQETRHILRMWDYLICSDSSCLVFLISAILLHMMPAANELDSATIMETCQQLKNDFVIDKDNIEYIIREAEQIRYKICRSQQWVTEYNELLLPGSKYRVRYIGFRRIFMNTSWTGPILSTILAIVLFYALTQSIQHNQKVKMMLMPFYTLAYSTFFKVKEIAYYWAK